jgi:hypothetical protein
MSERIVITQDLDQMKYGPEEGNFFHTRFENRNGLAHGMKQMEVSILNDLVGVFFVGQRGVFLRGGFYISKEDFKQMCIKFLEVTCET